VQRAAEAGHVDEVIAPRHTRGRIAAVLEAYR
jgi:acetyl-CoA carboxylase carboxyltransferase component